MAYKLEDVGNEGEVKLGQEFLNKLGVKPGWRAYQFMGDNHIKIYFAPPKDYDELAGSLSKYVTEENKFSDEEWHKIKDKAWTAAIEEEYANGSKS